MTKILKTIIIIGFASILAMTNNMSWADEYQGTRGQTLSPVRPEDFPTPKHKGVHNTELEKEIMQIGPEPDEVDKEEYPDYLPGESEVLRVEPGPDLSRTEPFVNNAYK